MVSRGAGPGPQLADGDKLERFAKETLCAAAAPQPTIADIKTMNILFITDLLNIRDLFKGRHFDREIIILCVRWYLRGSAFEIS
jgi:hypothetical protein